MVKLTVKIVSMQDADKFNKLCSKFNCDMDLQSGKYYIDAKSIMGIFSPVSYTHLWKKSVQAMYRFCVLILFGSTGKAKWINVIKNSFVIPTHVSSSRFVVFSFSYLNKMYLTGR